MESKVTSDIRCQHNIRMNLFTSYILDSVQHTLLSVINNIGFRLASGSKSFQRLPYSPGHWSLLLAPMKYWYILWNILLKNGSNQKKFYLENLLCLIQKSERLSAI